MGVYVRYNVSAKWMIQWTATVVPSNEYEYGYIRMPKRARRIRWFVRRRTDSVAPSYRIVQIGKPHERREVSCAARQ